MKRHQEPGESSGAARKVPKAAKTKIAELTEHDARAFVTGEIMSVMRPAGTHNFSVTRLALDDGEIKVIAYQKCADTLFDAGKKAIFRYVYTKKEDLKYVKNGQERMWEANINVGSEIEVVGASAPAPPNPDQSLTLADVVQPGNYMGKLHMQILDKFIDSPLPLRQVGTRVGSVGTDGIHKAELYLQFTPPTKIAPGDELVLLHFETALNGNVLKITVHTVQDFTIVKSTERTIQSEKEEDDFEFPAGGNGDGVKAEDNASAGKK